MVISSGRYDSGCSFRIRILTFYPSRIQGLERHRIPDPYPQHCEEQILQCFGSGSGFNGVPDQDLGFLLIMDPGSRGQKGTSCVFILDLCFCYTHLLLGLFLGGKRPDLDDLDDEDSDDGDLPELE